MDPQQVPNTLQLLPQHPLKLEVREEVRDKRDDLRETSRTETSHREVARTRTVATRVIRDNTEESE